jgi:hypothetical protein
MQTSKTVPVPAVCYTFCAGAEDRHHILAFDSRAGTGQKGGHEGLVGYWNMWLGLRP